MISRIVIGEPYGQPRQMHGARIGKDGKAHSYNYAAKKNGQLHPVWKYRADIREAFKGCEMMEGPLQIIVVAFHSRPAYMCKPKFIENNGSGPQPKISRPDASNILKAVEDALEGVAYKNDSLIMSAWVDKLYAGMGQSPETFIEIRQMEKHRIKQLVEFCSNWVIGAIRKVVGD